MKKAKGIVMRVSGEKTIIVTSEGDFLEVPTPSGQPLVGQVIEVTPAPLKKSFYNRSILKYTVAAAVLLLVLAIGLFNPLFGSGTAAAYVALDIHSGVELYVNKEGKVIEARTVSKGTNNLLQGLDLEGRDVYRAVGLILQKAGAGEVLSKEQNLVLASVVPVDDSGLKVINEGKLRGVIREGMLDKKVSGCVMIGKADGNIKQQAEKHGMTVNNYLVYDRCRKGGLGVRAEEFRGGNIGRALAKANTSLPDLFPNQCFEVGQHSQGKVKPESEKGPGNAHGPNTGPEHGRAGRGAGLGTGGSASGSMTEHQGNMQNNPAQQVIPVERDNQTDMGGYGNMGEYSGSGGAMAGSGHKQFGRE